jgi:hypothetical protein
MSNQIQNPNVKILQPVEKLNHNVTPAKAGVHKVLKILDSHFRGNDRNGVNRSFPAGSLHFDIHLTFGF